MEVGVPVVIIGLVVADVLPNWALAIALLLSFRVLARAAVYLGEAWS
jgi:hypothetical protein